MKISCRKLAMLASLMIAPPTLANTPANSCQNDLKYIPTFLLENDTGAPEHWEHRGREHFDLALEDAIASTRDVKSDVDCLRVISNYLRDWRKNHLFVQPLEKSTNSSVGADTSTLDNDDKAPRLELLSEETALLTLPSFRIQYLTPLKTLFTNHRKQLEEHQNWIIDLRRNDGGTGETYSPILKWLTIDEMAIVDVEWRVTPDNINAQRKVCDFIGTTESWCTERIDALVKRMQEAPIKSYVSMEDKTINYTGLPENGPEIIPQKVVILTDEGCGSACEQFLLTARQSFRVKLVGRPSLGALDYSNLRPHLLPSGNFQLMYATSRSKRLPLMPVDLTGVMPDIYLPKPENDKERLQEILQVQAWLEIGIFNKNNSSKPSPTSYDKNDDEKLYP